MMVVGIDGNMWYCSNGLPLPEPNAKYTFERTLREAAGKYRTEFGGCDEVNADLLQYWNSTPEEYLAGMKAQEALDKKVEAT